MEFLTLSDGFWFGNNPCYDDILLCLIMFDDTGGPDMFQVGMREKSIGFPQMTSPTFSELGAVMFLLVKYLTIYTILMYNIYIYYIYSLRSNEPQRKKNIHYSNIYIIPFLNLKTPCFAAEITILAGELAMFCWLNHHFCC